MVSFCRATRSLRNDGMTLFGLALFVGVYALAVMSPGPTVTALVARTLAHGRAGAAAFIAGLVLGDLFWFGLAVGGLAAIAKTFQAAFLGIKYLGVAYLAYLAWKAWTAKPEPAASAAMGDVRTTMSATFTGLALTLGNPKTMMFFLAILPTVVDLQTLTVTGALECAAVIVAILPAVMAGYVIAADRARAVLRSESSMRLVNRLAGTAMAGAAMTIVSR